MADRKRLAAPLGAAIAWALASVLLAAQPPRHPPVDEYACDDGNYGLRDILSGARYEEQLAPDAVTKREQ